MRCVLECRIRCQWQCYGLPIQHGCRLLFDVHVILDGNDALDVAGNQDRLVDVFL